MKIDEKKLRLATEAVLMNSNKLEITSMKSFLRYRDFCYLHFDIDYLKDAVDGKINLM